MPYEFYQFLHLLGLIGVVSGFTNLLLSEDYSKKAMKFYGISILVMLVAGFGMIARLGLSVHTGWIGLKLIIWIWLSIAIPMIVKRYPQRKRKVFLAALAMVALAILLVVYKPL